MKKKCSSGTSRRYLFLVLTRTNTVVAKAIRFISGKPFSHVSISDDRTLSSMYSFCRDRKSLPLPAHFNEESLGTGIFGTDESIACEVYRIPISAGQYRIYKRMIAHFSRNRKKYGYSLFGLVAIFFGMKYEVTTRFVCSVWVGFMLRAIGVVPIREKPLSLYEPEDLRSISGSTMIYRGSLGRYPYRSDERGGIEESRTRSTRFVA